MSQEFSSWYENNYHELTGNGLWLRGGEPNLSTSYQFEDSPLTVLISRLSSCWDVADSYTHKILYEIITRNTKFYADLSFLPPPHDSELMTQAGVPWLLGTTSKRAGVSFDVIAFSNSIVQELINIPFLLEKSGIPLSKKERCDNKDLPLVILGGANALFSSSLLGDDPVVDGIFVGESSSAILSLFEIIRSGKAQGYSKYQILTEMESVPGFFQPESQIVTVKYSPAVLEVANLPSNPPVLYIADQPGRAQIPISEGCPCFCSFCAESWSRKPYREFTPGDVKKAAMEMKASLGATTVELYSFNFSMHESFYTILQDMVSLYSTIKVSSQRFDHIAEDSSLLQYLHAIGKSTFTCGLEGISVRLRRYLHKSLDEQKLRSSLSLLLRSPIRELKIFLIATGKETDEDFDEFREFLTGLLQLMQSSGRKPKILFSMTPLVRFPFTPLEHEDAPEPKVYHEIIHQTERLVKCRGMDFRIAADLNDYLLSQLLVRAQSSSVLSACYEAAKASGFVYYREVSELFMKELANVLKSRQLPLTTLLRGWNRSEYKGVPVQTEVDAAFLEESKVCADNFEDKGFCLGTNHHDAVCRGCGACKDSTAVERLTSRKDREAPSIEKFRRLVKESASKPYSCNFLVTIHPSRRGIPRSVIGALIAKALMCIEPEFIKFYKKYEHSSTENKFGSTWVTGSDILTCTFSADAEPYLTGNNELIKKVNNLIETWCTIECCVSSDAIFDYQLFIISPYKSDPSMYCTDHQLKYTSFKNGEGSYRYQFTPQTLKKQDILALVVGNSQEQSQLVIQPGPKFNLDQFLERSFQLPSAQCKVRIQTSLCMSPKQE